MTETMEKEKLEILNMISDKQITPEEGLKLLDAIQLENVKFISDSTKVSKQESVIKIITSTDSKKEKTKIEDIKFLEPLLKNAKLQNNIIKIDTEGNPKAKIISVEELDEILQPIFKGNFKKKSMPKKITIEDPNGTTQTIEL